MENDHFAPFKWNRIPHCWEEEDTGLITACAGLIYNLNNQGSLWRSLKTLNLRDCCFSFQVILSNKGYLHVPRSGWVWICCRGLFMCYHKKHAESLINRMEHEYSCLDTQHVTPEAINQLHVFFFFFATESLLFLNISNYYY